MNDYDCVAGNLAIIYYRIGIRCGVNTISIIFYGAILDGRGGVIYIDTIATTQFDRTILYGRGGFITINTFTIGGSPIFYGAIIQYGASVIRAIPKMYPIPFSRRWGGCSGRKFYGITTRPLRIQGALILA